MYVCMYVCLYACMHLCTTHAQMVRTMSVYAPCARSSSGTAEALWLLRCQDTFLPFFFGASWDRAIPPKCLRSEQGEKKQFLLSSGDSTLGRKLGVHCWHAHGQFGMLRLPRRFFTAACTREPGCFQVYNTLRNSEHYDQSWSLRASRECKVACVNEVRWAT